MGSISVMNCTNCKYKKACEEYEDLLKTSTSKDIRKHCCSYYKWIHEDY